MTVLGAVRYLVEATERRTKKKEAASQSGAAGADGLATSARWKELKMTTTWALWSPYRNLTASL